MGTSIPLIFNTWSTLHLLLDKRALGLVPITCHDGFCEIPHRFKGGERSILIKVRKSLPSRCVLKTLRGNPKGKTQKE